MDKVGGLATVVLYGHGSRANGECLRRWLVGAKLVVDTAEAGHGTDAHLIADDNRANSIQILLQVPLPYQH